MLLDLKYLTFDPYKLLMVYCAAHTSLVITLCWSHKKSRMTGPIWTILLLMKFDDVQRRFRTWENMTKLKYDDPYKLLMCIAAHTEEETNVELLENDHKIGGHLEKTYYLELRQDNVSVFWALSTILIIEYRYKISCTQSSFIIISFCCSLHESRFN